MPIPLLVWVIGTVVTAAAATAIAVNSDSGSSSSSDEERRRLEREAKKERAQKERDFILSCVKTELTGLCKEHISGTNPIQVSSFDKLREAFKTNPQNNPILRQLQQKMNESQDAIKGRLEILRLEQELNALRLAKQALIELDVESLLMATDTRCERRDFLAALAQLRSEFNAAKVDIKTREERLENALSELVDSVKDAAGTSGLKEGNQLAQAVKDTNIKIAAGLKNWRGDVNRHQRNTEFREKFGDSLLVYVYGKVKAGKSSIGNYVAYGHGDPHHSIIDAAEPTPEFFFEAIAEAEDAKKPEAELTAAALEEKRKLAAQRKFAVGACETTKSIQGFKLSGLTWIDSPGLHSTTEENGGLAQKYVAAADLESV